MVDNPYFRGYRNLPEQTSRAMSGGIYHTGDICRVREDGNLLYLNRKDFMIKINGCRVEPGDIDYQLFVPKGSEPSIPSCFKLQEPGMPPEKITEALLKVFAHDVQKPVPDLNQFPYRCKLCVVNDHLYILYFLFQHAIIDGASVMNMFQALDDTLGGKELWQDEYYCYLDRINKLRLSQEHMLQKLKEKYCGSMTKLYESL